MKKHAMAVAILAALSTTSLLTGCSNNKGHATTLAQQAQLMRGSPPPPDFLSRYQKQGDAAQRQAQGQQVLTSQFGANANPANLPAHNPGQ